MCNRNNEHGLSPCAVNLVRYHGVFPSCSKYKDSPCSHRYAEPFGLAFSISVYIFMLSPRSSLCYLYQLE